MQERAANGDRKRLSVIDESMNNGIFHKRLNGERGQCNGSKLVWHIVDTVELIREPELLDVHVVANMPELLVQRNEIAIDPHNEAEIIREM